MALTLRLHKAVEVPNCDTINQSDPFVNIEVVAADETVLATDKSNTIKNCKDPVWESEHCFEGASEWDPAVTEVRLTLYDKDLIGSKRIGMVSSSFADLIAVMSDGAAELLVRNDAGNPVLGSQKPYWPCVLSVSLDPSTIPEGWPPIPEKVEYSASRHIFMITRGTRGDVQPFVALARGMAEEQGWKVTVCTELRWRSFVLGKTKDLSQGQVLFLDSGGDTETRVNSALGQWATNQKSEFMQMMMLSNSEAEFFNSCTVIMKHLQDLKDKGMAADMLVYGMTLTSIALIASEIHGMPAVGFILQPSLIPSSDPNWTAVQAIETHGKIGLLDSMEESLFTSQDSLAFWKKFAEKNPFASYNVNTMRGWFGLGTADTWTAMREGSRPVVIPMRPGTFDKPQDWWDDIILTDFIFLRTGGGGGGSLPEAIENFIAGARDADAKLGLMTFSSMPVRRATMLKCATKMIKECSFNLRLIYVGKRNEDSIPSDLAADAETLESEGRFLETERADFGVLFPRMDIFIVHGGLGTTVEALRLKKPTTVTGPLLLDQRFWGNVCHQKGVGLPVTHIDNFEDECLKFVDGALNPEDPEGWQAEATKSDWGDSADDGVKANVDCFAELLARSTG